MKITARLIVSLLFVVALAASFFAYWQVRVERARMADELERRAAVLSEGLSESAVVFLQTGERSKLDEMMRRFGRRERLLGLGVFDQQGELLSPKEGLSGTEDLRAKAVQAVTDGQTVSGFGRMGAQKVHYYLSPLRGDDGFLGVLLLLHDADYIDLRLRQIWQYNFIRLLVLSFVIVLTTLLVVRWSVTGPIAQVAEWIKQFRLGEAGVPLALPRGDVLGSLATEVSQMAKSLAAARAAAEQEAQLRLSSEAVWTPEKLREHVRSKLGDRTLYVVSNREPYMHVRQRRKIECIVPASGLVTALEPVLRACGGMWIAQGSGDADRETCDAEGKVRVPPDEPAYTLKRIWLTKEEEDGHYYGFSNEGLWPLCHITHNRPSFRLEDWVHYQGVNQKFADAVLEEVRNEESPLILIQDYHFALLPLLIRDKRPDARIALFWHIPWPNPESFGICPWKQEILLGMLGADIIGFHIQYHCNNFLDTVDANLECKLDWEHFSVERSGRSTQIKAFPISVAPWKTAIEEVKGYDPEKHRLMVLDAVRKEHGIKARHIAVGVDRLDYTKGIVERFKAIERFLDKYPEYVGQFTFVQLGAPSRTHIPKYHEFIAEVEKTAEAVNWRFQTREWKPIVLQKGHHSHAEILPFYKAADVCLVTSLHDGMNLVAKEFVAARDDEDGVLILSPFTGASRELTPSLIVNPYDTEALADSIRLALTMPPEERKERMRKMRQLVKERNIYRWAGNLISALTQLPAPRPGTV